MLHERWSAHAGKKRAMRKCVNHAARRLPSFCALLGEPRFFRRLREKGCWERLRGASERERERKRGEVRGMRN